MQRTVTRALLLLPAVALLAPPTAMTRPLLERDVLPILTKHCMGCHSDLMKMSLKR